MRVGTILLSIAVAVKVATAQPAAALDSLLVKAKGRTDLQAAQEMQKAKADLFALFNTPAQRREA